MKDSELDERIHKKLGLAYYVLRRKPARMPPKMWCPVLKLAVESSIGDKAETKYSMRGGKR